MPSTIWIGSINFGSTSIPVKLHTAVKEDLVQFHLLHKTDRVRLRQQMICAYDKSPVPAEEQVKGFKVDERKYVLIGQDELEETEPESGRSIDIHEFVAEDSIDPVFAERTYYLEPDNSSKSYAAFAAALSEMNARGICTWVMRKRAYFGAVSSSGGTLKLNTLRYADEVIPAKSLEIEQFTLTDKELEIGAELIKKLTVKFKPEKYVNEHQIRLREFIDKKARGMKITLLKPKHLKATQPDKLLETLQKSLKRAA